jgi:hypothetical protein
MLRVNVVSGQSWLDVALQSTGTIETVFDIALLNAAGAITDMPPSRPVMVVEPVDYRTVKIMSDKRIVPASVNELEPEQCGIGCMAIGNDFLI